MFRNVSFLLQHVNRMPRNRLPRLMKHCSQLAEGIMADLWRDFWIHETGSGQQVAQLHDRYVVVMIFLVHKIYTFHVHVCTTIWPAPSPKGRYPLLNADINGLYLVQISGLWVSSYYSNYTQSLLFQIQTVAHCSRQLQAAAQSDHNNNNSARAHTHTHTHCTCCKNMQR